MDFLILDAIQLEIGTCHERETDTVLKFKPRVLKKYESHEKKHDKNTNLSQWLFTDTVVSLVMSEPTIGRPPVSY
jgi:hypothetical protein